MDKYERSQQRAYFEAYELIEEIHKKLNTYSSITYATLAIIENKIKDDSIKPTNLKKQIKQILKASNDFQEELKWQENQELTN